MDGLAYGLVDMHAEVLLAITAETNGVVVEEHLFNAIDESTFGHLQLAQDAHDQLWIADCSPYAGKRLLQIPDKINTAGPRRMMPSSMAQKKVRLPSGLVFWIERT